MLVLMYMISIMQVLLRYISPNLSVIVFLMARTFNNKAHSYTLNCRALVDSRKIFLNYFWVCQDLLMMLAYFGDLVSID